MFLLNVLLIFLWLNIFKILILLKYPVEYLSYDSSQVVNFSLCLSSSWSSFYFFFFLLLVLQPSACLASKVLNAVAVSQ